MSAVVKVVPTDDGPLHIAGEFVVEDEAGNRFDVRGDAWLCRCGASEHKPFCDGRHGEAGFQNKCRSVKSNG